MQRHRSSRAFIGRGCWLVLLAAGLLAVTKPADAGEGSLLWAATKPGDTLLMRPGLALGSKGDLRLGLESSLETANASRPGTIAAPLVVWGEVDLPGRAWASVLAMRLDARTTAGRVVLRRDRRLAANASLDLSLSNALEAGKRADGSNAFVARQETRLDFLDIGAALAGTVVLDNAAPVSASLKLEQQLPLGISVSATFADLGHASEAVLRARMHRQW